jgi:putative transposase
MRRLGRKTPSRHDTKAAKRLLGRLLKKQGCPPRRMITEKLGSYAAARRQVMPRTERRSHKGFNDRAENSHLPLRRRERIMQGFRSPGGLQRFTLVFFTVRNSSSHPVPAAPHLQPIFIASRLWQCGSLQPASLLEPVR